MDILFNFLVASVGLLTVLYLWKFKWCQRRLLAAANKLPRPFTIPILGNAYMALGGIDKITEKLNRLSAKFGGVFCCWLGPVPVFVVSDPEALKIILNSQKTMEKDDGYEYLKAFLGNGLMTAPVQIWKRNRRLLSPVFNQKNVEESIPVMNNASYKLAEQFETIVGQSEMDVHTQLVQNFAESVTRAVLGLKVDIFESQISTYYTKFQKRISKLLIYRFTKFWLAIDSVFYYVYRKDMEEFDSTLKNLMNEFFNEEFFAQRKLTQKGNTSSINMNDSQPLEDEGVTKTFRDILLDLMEMDPTYTEKDMMFEMFTTLGPAIDSSSSTLGFCLLTLANNQEVQEKLYREIHNIFGDSQRYVTVEDIQSMEYLDCVIKESLRRYRIVPYIARKATEDLKLSSCTIPAGGRIVININGLHSDPSIYPDPLVFDPDRFTPENMSKRHPYSFLPFSGGPRGCIGKNYAMSVMKVTLVNVLRRFKVSTTTKLEDIVYVIELTMGSKDGFPLKFTRRK